MWAVAGQLLHALASFSTRTHARTNTHTRAHTHTHTHAPPQMEGMVTDLALAREKQSHFEEWMENRGKKAPVDVQVTVGGWVVGAGAGVSGSQAPTS